jgi:hypothetical protein
MIASHKALPVKIESCFGVLESMKSQTPSTKLQTNLKFQYSMTKTQNKFGILVPPLADYLFDI